MFCNTYTPREKYTQLLLRLEKNKEVVIANYIIALVNAGKKVYGMITSKKFGDTVAYLIKKAGICVIFYHGSDHKCEED